MTRPFLLAQVSDLHIKAGGQLSYRVFDTVAMLRACVRHAFSPESGLASHIAYLGEFAGPYSFRE